MDLMNLIQGDCLVELKKLKDKSIDFVYLDLPYNQTACHWDVKLDHHALWIELKRIAKNDRTPFFFSCTTKFGFELYNTAPKGWFRWDLVWEKNRAAGFLNAYKLPMRKHEMVYCFAKKLPDYDVSSHNEFTEQGECYKTTKVYGKSAENSKKIKPKVHKDPLPSSVLPPQEDHELVYCFAKKSPDYDVSSHSEREKKSRTYTQTKPNGGLYGMNDFNDKKNGVFRQDRINPLPTSVLPPQEDHELVYCFAKKSPEYDVSSHSEFVKDNRKKSNLKSADLYGLGKGNTKLLCGKDGTGGISHKDPLPTSVLPPQEDHELVYCFAKKTPEYDVSSHSEYVEETGRHKEHQIDTYGKKGQKCVNGKTHKDPLPTSVLPPQDI
jgi:hypothetical protein